MQDMNRLWNVNNPYQKFDKHPRVLCVCSAGLLRSPTLAWVLSNEPYNFNTRAVGLSRNYALLPVDSVNIQWADKIVFVEEDLMNRAWDLFQEELTNKEVYALDIPDRFEYRDPELVTIINSQLVEMFNHADRT